MNDNLLEIIHAVEREAYCVERFNTYRYSDPRNARFWEKHIHFWRDIANYWQSL